jgi:hypothetical protein
MEHELAKHALSHERKKSEKKKALKEMHVKELHDGTYHIMKHHGHPEQPPTEGSAQDLDQVHDAMEEHLGADQPNEGEQEMMQQPEAQAGE